MAANALEMIKQAEAEAKQIRQNAADKAQSMLSTAEKDGQALLEQARAEAIAERSASLARATEQAKSLQKSAESDAKLRAVVLTSKAEQNLPEAEKLILERIATLWQ